MRCVVTGASGFIGSAVVRQRAAAGDDVLRLVRHPRPEPGEAQWDPGRGHIEQAALEGLDAAVHLAGESIAVSRWTEARKDRIRESRVQGTSLLATALARCARPPRVLVCASAAGWYGDRGEAVLDESAPPGTGFLAATCRAWEAAADPARARGIRVVHLRFGLVLDASGGVLGRLLPIFRFGLGAPLGSGRQWWSWVTLDDVLAAVLFALERDIAGPVNVVSPEPTTNAAFTRTLCRALHRPMLPAVPAWMLRLVFGEMADEVLLSSARLAPARLQEAGFAWREPDLEPALDAMLRGT